MSNPIPNASPFGGVSPGADVYAYSGDFTRISPCSAPRINYPFRGDSFPSKLDIISSTGSPMTGYDRYAFDTYPNIQRWAPNQKAIIIEQDFMVHEAYYVTPLLNSAYDMSWSVGWSSGWVNLAECFLVEELNREPLGAGIIKVTRRYANLPPTRNVLESFHYTYPALSNGRPGAVDTYRMAFPTTVMSRVQYDFFIYDNSDLLPWIPLFPNGGRLNAGTGLRPTGIILTEQRYYKGVTAAIANNFQIDAGQPLTDHVDATADLPEVLATIPSYSEYLDWTPSGTTHVNGPAEIVVEASTFGPGPWLGNIYIRKTRFAVAQ